MAGNRFFLSFQTFLHFFGCLAGGSGRAEVFLNLPVIVHHSVAVFFGVKESVQLFANIFYREKVTNQLFHYFFSGNQIHQRHKVDFDEYLFQRHGERRKSHFIYHHLRGSYQRRFERGRTGIDHGGAGVGE